MREMKVIADIKIATELDNDGELEFFARHACDYLDKDDAIALVNHLVRVFDLSYE